MPQWTDAVVAHACYVADHAVQVGLVSEGLNERDALARLDDLHPRLALLAAASEHVRDEHISEARSARITYPWSTAALVNAGPADIAATYQLGDRYQALSVEARKGRALCQTPFHIAELLVDLAYGRASETWENPRVLDPSCGTGHILVAAYGRVRHSAPRSSRAAWKRRTPAETLDLLRGVDLDPWAATVAAYRLLARAWIDLRLGGAARSAVADLPVHIDSADSLLGDSTLLAPGSCEVVVANPPYITSPSTEYARQIRGVYSKAVTHRKFSLALPFHELMMRTLVPGGWCAQLTANSFMKREFGKRYVEDWLPRFHTEWVIDTSGAYIPGHGTPTVILVHQNGPPRSETVHAVLGKRGAPGRPARPQDCPVWRSIETSVRGTEAVLRLNRTVLPASDPPPAEADPEPVTQPTLFDLMDEQVPA